MKYNIFLKTQTKTENILDITDESLNIVVESYNNGNDSFFIQGKKYWLNHLFEIQVYTFENEQIKTKEDLIKISEVQKLYKKDMFDKYLPKEILEKIGCNVTENFIKGDFGQLKLKELEMSNLYIAKERIDEIKNIVNADFDLTKLIAMLEELNLAYANKMVLTLSFLVRAIKDHTPPIFGQTDFNQVANSRTKSIKANFLNLENSLKNIADANIHQHIRKQENLPTMLQVDFKNDLDVLLQEIVRINKK
jgi:hypothetical protein